VCLDGLKSFKLKIYFIPSDTFNFMIGIKLKKKRSVDFGWYEQILI